jgi:hypothetical protein
MKKTITILFLLLGFYSFSQHFNINIDSLRSVLATAKEDSNKVKILNRLSIAYAWSKPDTGIVYAEGKHFAVKKNKI